MSTVLITGASRGIGAACAKLFAENGWTVLANYKSNAEAAEKLKKSIGCRLYKADVSNMSDVIRMKQKIDAECLSVDALINNAGVSLFGLFQDISADQASIMYGTNLFGALNCSRAFLPSMLEKKRGCIINVSSVWGEVGASCEVDYSTAKAAIVGFTKALSKEVGYSGVRVNCLAPGIIDTDMNSELSIEDVADIVDSVPLERLGKPVDVANAALFLASEKAEYITGHVLCIDGGWKG